MTEAARRFVSIEISWPVRARAYGIGIALTFLSVPFVHLYLAVELDARELLIHAADIALSTAIAIAVGEVAVSGLQRRLDWRFEGVRGALGLAAVPLAMLAAWAWTGMHDVLPETDAIRHKHLTSGYGDISLRVLPVSALVLFLTAQAVRLANVRRELEEQREVNAALEARQHASSGPAPRPRITLTNESGEITVDPSAVVRVRAQENYCEFVLSTGPPWLVRMTLAEARELLPADGFVQTHRSHLANLDRVLEFVRGGREASLRLSEGQHVPIARSRASEVRARVRAHLEALRA